MHRTQEKYLRMCACENTLLETPSFKHVNFQKNYFSMPSLSEDNRELSVHITILQRKSRNMFMVVVMDFWWVIQSPAKSSLSIHGNFKEKRTYCIISRLCKLFMSKLCNLRFFFWSNVEIWFTFSNSSRACFESLG